MARLGDWTADLPALVACGVLPELPPLAELRTRAEAALRQHDAACAAEAHGAGDSGLMLFPSQLLYDAVLGCVAERPGLPQRCRAAAALLLCSAAMEDHVRSHSTRAMIVSANMARARAGSAAAAAADDDDAAAAGSSGSGRKRAADAAAGGGGDADAEEDEEAELVAFLSAASPGAVADRLLSALREPPGQRAHLMSQAEKHDAATLAAVLRETKRTYAAGDNQRADGSGRRTLGGIFYRELKRHKAGAQRALTRQALPPLPPLRPYQRDVAGMVLSSWGLRAPPQLLEAGAEGGAEAGAEARFRRLARQWGGNWLVSAPTNSGKTRMFVEVVRGLVTSAPAIVVVLVPQVLLTTQHLVHLEQAALPRTAAEAHSSDNPLTQLAWAAALKRRGAGQSSVLVATAASFVNLLACRAASTAQLDLLVLDEAHHCKDDHPYAQVLTHLGPAAGAAGAAGAGPRILGVTASPASEKDPVTLALRMGELLGRLSARLHVVDDEAPEVAAVLPEPKQAEVVVAGRAADRQLMLALQAFAIHTTQDLARSLGAVTASGSQASQARAALLEKLRSAAAASEAAPCTGELLAARLDTVGQCLSSGREFAALYGCLHLDLACRFLDVLRKAVELVEDAGFEGALPFLARKAVALCREEAAAAAKQAPAAAAAGAGAAGAGSRRSALAPPPSSGIRGAMLSAAAAANAARSEGRGGGSEGQAARREPKVFAQLRAAAESGPCAAVIASGLAAVAAARTTAPPGNSCSDVSLRVSELLQQLLVAGRPVAFLAAPAATALFRDCFASGKLEEDRCFPKFWALLQYLEGYRGREAFHGIVFVKTRQAVYHVADMMRRCSQLQFCEVLELIGHSTVCKRSALAPERDRHGRGMSDTEQQQVLQLFKSAGRKVLVATSAAEEGLDVPSCEFVVRYNAAATGIQLLQSRGRARVRASEFVAILQEGTQDCHLHAKSRQEEANMRNYQRTHAAAGGDSD